MSQRALVTVVRSRGDVAISDAIIRGVVSREIRLMQAERDMLRQKRRDDLPAKIAEARARYAIKPENPVRRAFEQCMALITLLTEWHRDQKAMEADEIW